MKELEKRLVDARVGGRWDHDDKGYKRINGGICMMQLFCISAEVVVTLIYTGNKIALNFIARVHKCTHTQRVLVKLRKSVADCIHAIILVAILPGSYARCYPWRKLGEGYMGSLCIIS